MEFNIGSVIKKVRQSKNITQAVLADNSCSIKQLSRIESNQSIPSTLLLQEFSLKLGEDLSMFFHYLGQPDPIFCYNTIREIDNLTNLYNYEAALKKSYKILESYTPDKSYYFLQLTYFHENAKSHLKVHDPDTIKKLKYALSLSLNTIEDINDMFNHIINSLQYKIISLIILSHLENKEYDEALKLLEASIASYEKFYLKIEDPTYTKMIYNLARLHFVKDDYVNSAKISLKGIEHCKATNQLSHLAYLSLVRGRSLHNLGDEQEGLKYINLFIYLSDLCSDHKDKEIIIHNVKSRYNM